MARKKTKVVRINPTIHKNLVRLAALEQRDVSDVADRILAAGLERDLARAQSGPPMSR